MHSFVLFLDFDGVLHRGTTGTLRHAAALAALLDEFPGVDIVISSTWRLTQSFPDLIGWLPESLASRVVGVTPEAPVGLPAARQREVEGWLRGREVRTYCVLDDEPRLFAPGYPALLETDPLEGLTPRDLGELRRRLEQSL